MPRHALAAVNTHAAPLARRQARERTPRKLSASPNSNRIPQRTAHPRTAAAASRQKVDDVLVLGLRAQEAHQVVELAGAVQDLGHRVRRVKRGVCQHVGLLVW